MQMARLHGKRRWFISWYEFEMDFRLMSVYGKPVRNAKSADQPQMVFESINQKMPGLLMRHHKLAQSYALNVPFLLEHYLKCIEPPAGPKPDYIELLEAAGIA
jgi:hypothetical protein